MTRDLFGHTVQCYQHETPLHDLEMLGKLIGGLEERLGRKVDVLEVGSWVGESAVAICQHMELGGTLTCVDTWQGSPTDWTGELAQTENILRLFLENTKEFRVTPIPKESTEAAQLLSDKRYDAIFIDADHSYESVKRDIDAWLPLAEYLIIGHDYCNAFPGVIQAANELAESLDTYARTANVGSVWWIPLEGQPCFEKTPR